MESEKPRLLCSSSSFSLPKKIYFCEDIPINGMGKVNKTKLIQSVKDP